VTSEQDRPNPKAPQAKGVDDAAAASHDDLRKALVASGIFRRAHPDVLSAVVAQLQPVDFPAGHVVFRQGDPGGSLYIVVSGKAKVSYRHRDDGHVILNVVGPSDVFGEVTPFDSGAREVTATTLTEVRAVPIEPDRLQIWMAEFPEVILQITRLLARRAQLMTTSLADFMLADPPYRVARRLLLLAKRFGERDGEVVRVEHDLTPEELALFAGVTPDVIDATLGDFGRRGWIRCADDCLVIVNRQALAGVPAGDRRRR
jgi:CRP/FNR family transcriptional regulator, cyclic AMP receptor protein